MICARCGRDADPPNVREALDIILNDWVYIHKKCSKKEALK